MIGNTGTNFLHRYLKTLPGFLLIFGLRAMNAYASSEAEMTSVSEADRLLGPLVLVKPLAPQTLTFLLNEAESQYRFGNPSQALRGFETIVSVVPTSAKAWLRIGNLHHQGGRVIPALEAYRRSAQSHDEGDGSSRQKAWMNICLLHIAEAETALDALEREAGIEAQTSPVANVDEDSSIRERELKLRSSAGRTAERAAEMLSATRRANFRSSK